MPYNEIHDLDAALQYPSLALLCSTCEIMGLMKPISVGIADAASGGIAVAGKKVSYFSKFGDRLPNPRPGGFLPTVPRVSRLELVGLII